MIDLPPMDACPTGRKGRHDLTAIIPDDADQDMTLFCGACGSIRRLPVTGAVLADRLDDMSASEIERRIAGRR